MKILFISPKKQDRQRLEDAIYAEREELISMPGQYVTGVNKFICDKYGISVGTLYQYCRRAKQRAKANM